MKESESRCSCPMCGYRMFEMPYDRKTTMLSEIESEEACFRINDLAINGSDLINKGVPSSPEIGRILKILLDEVMDEKLTNDKNALLARAAELKMQKGEDNENFSS